MGLFTYSCGLTKKPIKNGLAILTPLLKRDVPVFPILVEIDYDIVRVINNIENFYYGLSLQEFVNHLLMPDHYSERLLNYQFAFIDYYTWGLLSVPNEYNSNYYNLKDTSFEYFLKNCSLEPVIFEDNYEIKYDFKWLKSLSDNSLLKEDLEKLICFYNSILHDGLDVYLCLDPSIKLMYCFDDVEKKYRKLFRKIYFDCKE